jgi:hypothetical protein
MLDFGAGRHQTPMSSNRELHMSMEPGYMSEVAFQISDIKEVPLIMILIEQLGIWGKIKLSLHYS